MAAALRPKGGQRRPTLVKLSSAVLALFCFFLALPAQAQLPRGARGVTGVVSSIEGTTVKLVDGRLTVDVSRAVVRSDSGPGTIADIKAGDRISVQLAGRSTESDVLAADFVQILRFPDALLSGEAEAVDGPSGVLTLLGLPVRVTSATILRGLRGEAISLADVRPHQQVRVELDATQPGLAAKTVIVSSPVPDHPNTFIGVIEKIEGDTWTVRASDATVVLKTNAETQITGTPRAGDRVMVTYRTDASGQNIALSISIAHAQPPRSERPMAGTVTELTDTSLTVTIRPTNDFARLVVNGETRFFGGRPAIGDHVMVFFRNENQTNIATRVVRIDSGSENRITFEGRLNVIEGNKWLIDTHEVIVNQRTRIVGDPKPGDIVHVIATQSRPDLTLHGIEISKIR
jgi:hypothetical protein